MAENWIKIRSSLLQSPKLIRMTRLLNDEEDFREWLTPGGANNGRVVSQAASRIVTFGLLTVTWSVTREFGKFQGDDLVLGAFTIPDLSELSGAPCVGRAMEGVGWAIEDPGQNRLILPNFREYNVPKRSARPPKTPAERSRDYRARKREREELRASQTSRFRHDREE